MSLALSLLVLLSGPATPQPAVTHDPWAAVQFMVGDWVGESEGQPGKGTVRRSYHFVLGDRFLHEKNVSTYPPQPRNERGETHEHWSLFSHDRARHTLVLRQFHQEGFVNQYVMAAGSPAGTLVFESEALESVPSGWRARETYQVLSPDEFVETFELSSGAGPFEVYSRTRFKRAARPAAGGEVSKGLEALRFLLGEWRGEGGGRPGEASGGFTFAPSLDGRVLVRTNFAEYPATADKPAFRHDDLMVLYATESGQIAADFYDSEGHVIRYDGSTPSPNELVLASAMVSGAPRFRLSYKLRADGVLEGRFEVAPPGKPEFFGPYLTWTARRLEALQ